MSALDIEGPEWAIFRANPAGVGKTNKPEAKAGERHQFVPCVQENKKLLKHQ